MKEINKIYFLLPGMDINSKRKCVPVGGYKVIYEYANMLASKGFKVVLAYSHARCKYDSLWSYVYSFLGFYYRKLFKQLKGGTYFSFHKTIEKKFYYRFSTPWLKLQAKDIAFATAYVTANELFNIKELPLNRKYYFIQDYELWADKEEKLKESYCLGMHNIVIAPWLLDKVKEAGAEAACIPDGFNFTEFSLKKAIETRDRYHIVMLYHELEHKRCNDSWAALEIVKKNVPKLHVTMFGTFPLAKDFPSWYTYYQNPSKAELNAIYNQGAIYIAASDFEGFGLTIGEAMICGCAIACTNNGGFSCMAKDNRTALLSEIYNVKELAKNIERLIGDDALRIKLARQGNEYIKNFTWKSSLNKLLKLL